MTSAGDSSDIVVPSTADIVVPSTADIVVPSTADIVVPSTADIVVPSTAKVTPSTRPAEERREVWRGWLALVLMALLSLLAIALVTVTVWLVRPFDRETVGLLIAGVFGPIIGLVGTVVGFYFGQVSVSGKDEGGLSTASRPGRQRQP
jgi:hypothetical protein